MSDRKTARKIVQLQAGLDEDREELAALLGEIRYQAQPKVQAQILMSDAKEKATEVKDEAVSTFQAALQGDGEAILRVVITAAGAAAVGALLFLGIRRNTRERRQQREWRKFTKALGRNYPPQAVEFTVR